MDKKKGNNYNLANISYKIRESVSRIINLTGRGTFINYKINIKPKESIIEEKKTLANPQSVLERKAKRHKKLHAIKN
jgi:ABC-type tungstate transport system permease subunit